MINVKLSDHTGDKKEAAKSEREQLFQTQLDAYAQALDARTAHSQNLTQMARQAFSGGHYLTWAFMLLRQVAHFFGSRPQAPTPIAVSRDEEVWEAGSEGEYRVRAYLSCRLDDRYTLFEGYRNRGGEVDLLLVGPTGIHAVEVKYINGLIHCNGDVWNKDKFDRYGNAVEVNVPITDRGGRGPSRQVNEAADQLESFLTSQSFARAVRRAVIFCHDHSTLGTIHKPTVDCVSLLKNWDVLAFLNAAPDGSESVTLTDTQVFQLVKLIERDHGYHNRPVKTHSSLPAGQSRTPSSPCPAQFSGSGTRQLLVRSAGRKE